MNISQGLFASLILLAVASAATAAAIIPIDKSFAVSLNGTWRFRLEASEAMSTPPYESFYSPDYGENTDWHDFEVPGNWEMAGFSPATYWNPDNASGQFRRTFKVPSSWKGRLVKIDFDGVQHGAEIWINGMPVSVTEPAWGRHNYHESSWTAWQADITAAVRFGEENLLALRLTKNSKSANLDSGDYYCLGGIYRPVTLFSVPETHISDLTITTHLLGDDRAEVQVAVEITGGDAARMSMKLQGQKEISTEVRGSKVRFSQFVTKPRLWSAEYPNLYDLEVSLEDAQGRTLEKLTRRVGITEVTIEDGVLRVNGRIVKLAGICRHDLSANEGCAVGPELWRKDLTLMKAANINSIRTSHYPYGTGFYDLCDEMGFYVLDELPYCWCPTDTDDLTPAFAWRARETIARDKNHPCVIMWGIGNENRPGKNLQIVADIVKSLDATRPRLVSEQPADRYGVELDDAHYTPPERILQAAKDKQRRAKWPKLYSENPNVWDVRLAADYGCLDLWGEVIKRTWDVVWKCDDIPGTFLWEWQDRAVADKCPVKLHQWDEATGTNYMKVKGLVDSRRNVRPDYYHLKVAASPIQVANKADLGAGHGCVVLDITNHYSFTDLSELKTHWQLTKEGEQVRSGRAKLKLAPRSSGKVALALPEDALARADTLKIDFDHPQGWNVVTCQFQLVRRKAKSAMVPRIPDGLGMPTLNLTSRNRVESPGSWRVDFLTRYQLRNVKSTPANLAAFSELQSLEADIVSAESWTTPRNPTPPLTPEAIAKANPPKLGEVVGRVHAELLRCKFSYRIEWTGDKADIQELGWVFEMPRGFDHFSWDRKAMWSYYPETHIGRANGTATPDSADAHLLDVSRPDAFDFNSTKYNCNWASLTDASGRGLRVAFSAKDRHHVRGGIGADGTYQLIVNKLCCPPRDISTNCVPDLCRELNSGDVIEGSFVIGSNQTE